VNNLTTAPPNRTLGKNSTNLMQRPGAMGKFATVLSSDSVGPEDYCMLAYQDSETDLT